MRLFAAKVPEDSIAKVIDEMACVFLHKPEVSEIVGFPSLKLFLPFIDLTVLFTEIEE